MSASDPFQHPYGRSADDVRRRTTRTQRQRRQRITSLVVLSLLVIAVVAAAGYAWTVLQEPAENPGSIGQTSDPPADAPGATAEDGTACPPPGAVPAAPGDVDVVVLNSTSRRGLAGEVTGQLADRGYRTGSPGNASEAVDDVLIVHGPQQYLEARAVAAQFAAVQLRMDPETGEQVQVIIGESYTGLVEDAAAQAALSEPVQVPPGCPDAAS